MFYVLNVIIKVQWVTIVTISDLCSHSQKSSERSLNSMWWLRKERDNLHQSNYCRHMWTSAIQWWCPCIQVGMKWPDFRRSLSEDQWCILLWEMLLAQIQKLLLVICEVSDKFFIFLQDNAPAHRACKTINLLKGDTCFHFARPFGHESAHLNLVYY